MIWRCSYPPSSSYPLEYVYRAAPSVASRVMSFVMSVGDCAVGEGEGRRRAAREIARTQEWEVQWRSRACIAFMHLCCRRR